MAGKDAPDIEADGVDKTACPECGQVVDVSDADVFATVKCPECRANFSAPGKLAHFVLLKLLGQGEMGVTFRAFEKSLGRYVAIKVMRKSLLDDKKRVDDFFAEARALASLDHPNVARAYSVGQEKGQPYIAMELITGKRLDQLYTSAEPLNEVRALDIAIGVASALRAANEIGLIHGDVKPANIMLDEKEEARLVDFGIARFGGGRVAEDAALGTPYYVAPEQVARESVDYRADMYSLGATLFHALAGEPPFPGKTMKKVLLARLNRRAPDLLTSRPFLRRKTASVVARMLQTRPDARHRTYVELLRDLEAARMAALGEAPQREPDSRVGVEEQPAPAKRRWPILAGAAGLLVVAAAAAYVLHPWSGTSSPQPSAGAGDSFLTDTPQGQTAAPVFSPPGRTIASPVNVTLESATNGARIYYTIDGRVPTRGSIRYGAPIRVKPGTTVRARAYHDDCEPSPIVQARY